MLKIKLFNFAFKLILLMHGPVQCPMYSAAAHASHHAHVLPPAPGPVQLVMNSPAAQGSHGSHQGVSALRCELVDALIAVALTVVALNSLGAPVAHRG